MVAAVILKRTKIEISRQGLTDRYEIWHGDAIRHLWCVPQLEICNFKNPTWRPPFRKIEKLIISQPQFQRLQRNLARWRSSALWPIGGWSVTYLRSKEIEDGGGRHANNIKITISRKRFDRFAQHLAYNDVYWSSEEFTKVRTPVSVREFCVRKFLRTCVTLFTKLRTKNRKFARSDSELPYDQKCS